MTDQRSNRTAIRAHTLAVANASVRHRYARVGILWNANSVPKVIEKFF